MNKTVVKSMEVLALFYDTSALTLQEMVTKSTIPKTSLHRMVETLENMGFLEKDQEGKYVLGTIFLTFGRLVADRLDIRKMAYVDMLQLNETIQEAVNLIILQDKEALYIEKIDSHQPVQLYTGVGKRSPLYAGACARILFAHLPNEEQQAYLENRHLIKIATGTITDKVVLMSMNKEAREKGYTVSYSELADYTAAVSAPIYNHHGKVIAGISAAGLEAHFSKERLPFIIHQVKATAHRISAKLGYLNQS